MSKHFTALDAPTIHHSRSRFDLSHGVKTSMSVGTLYPIYLQDIYPGDTFNVDSAFVARLSSSFLRPVCDNLYIDIMYFFVPNRLVFDKWEQVFGENRESAWVQPEPVSAPSTDVYSVIESKTVGDYLGLPLGTLPKGIQFLAPRAFAKIYDDWFRDENLISPMFIQKGDFDSEVESFNSAEWSPSNYTGKLPKVAKFHDVFTSSLPDTQKALEPVKVPITLGNAPVIAVGEDVHDVGVAKVVPSSAAGTWNALGINTSTNNLGVFQLSGGPLSSNEDLSWNLQANLADAGLLNVTDLRYAFQLQRILERASRCGSRYTEYLLSAFGISSPDARLQRAEYLGGKRMPLSVQQVAQTTRGDSDSTELGSLGAFSLTNGKCGYHKGFVEHGFVIGVACIRQYHTYQQGVQRFWQRKDRFDFYDPILANISEVPVYKSEIYAPNSGADPTGNKTLTDEVFGYQEAWYDLRQRMNYVTGDMRSDSDTSFDIWHFADYYENAPTLNQQFINETPDYVDRTIAVPSTSADQFIVDLWHHQSAIRVLTPYSIPGLVDHH